MEVTLPISSLLVIAIGSVGTVVSIFMGILLLSQKDKKHPSTSILAWLLLLSGCTLLNDVLATSGISNRLPFLYFIPLHYSLSIPPLFYLFIKSKFNHRLQRRDLIHLMIPLMQAAVYFVVGFRSAEFKSSLYHTESFRMFLQAESYLFPFLLLAYTIAALLLLNRKKENAFFWTEDIRSWLYQFSIGMLVIVVFEFILETRSDVMSSSDIPFYLGHMLILSAFVFWISINSFKQYYPLQVFQSRPESSEPFIGEIELATLLKQLDTLMTKEKVYLNPDLTLEILSGYLGITEKHCSYVLNQGTGMNFNQYINKFRIEAFKERIERGQNKTFTLTSIAYECGFNSKSTFNRVFKTSCGMTPSAFVKQTRNAKEMD